MRVVVCIKQIGYVYHPIPIGVSEYYVDPDEMVFMLNPYDEIAVEEAIKVKEDFGGCEVIIITAGPPRAERTLRYAFAFGADKMIRINCDKFDPFSTSLILAQIIKDLKYDLILCGKKAIDTNAGQVGSFLAELVNIPQISGIVSLDILPDGKKAIVERYLGKGNRQVIECHFPALFTVENGLNDPRYPSLPNRLLAEKEKIQEIDVPSLGLSFDPEIDLSKNMNFSPPRPKPRKIFTPDSNLSAEERLALIMGGSSTDKRDKNLLEGSPEMLASRMLYFLINNRLLPSQEAL